MEEERAFNLPHNTIRASLVLIPLFAVVVLAIIIRSQLLIGGLLSLVSTGFGFYFSEKSKNRKEIKKE